MTHTVDLRRALPVVVNVALLVRVHDVRHGLHEDSIRDVFRMCAPCRFPALCHGPTLCRGPDADDGLRLLLVARTPFRERGRE